MEDPVAMSHLLDPISPMVKAKRYADFKANSSKEVLVSIGWTLDGSDKIKSSKKSIVPIIGVVNELPERIRNTPAFILILGIVVCKEKPPPNLYLRDLVEEMKKLEQGSLCQP
jgi:hypothetical protein